jgi:uncharacterized protein YbaP (TraB family)
MKKLLVALLATVSLATACATEPQKAQVDNAAAGKPAPATVARANLPDADPAMWVVKDEDTTIYLFGTFHLLDGKTDWLNDEVKQAFDQSQELVFEIDMPKDPAKMSEAMAPLMMRYAVDQQGRTISSRLTPEENKKLADALKAIGVPATAFDRFKPWFVNMMLSAVAAQKQGLTGENGAEEVLRRAAAGRNMKMGAVETIEGQIKLFDTMSDEEQLKQLKATLEQVEETDKALPRMLRAWNEGDVAAMEKEMNEGIDDPALRRVLLENRNRAWAEWIDQRLDAPGTVFMAVGAGHLVGPDSVQTFLKQRGIGSERVPQLTPAR